MTGTAAILPKHKFTSATGIPLANGTLTTYLAGTTTLSGTWQDSDLSTANTNPIELDAAGECTLWLDRTKYYKMVLKNSAGVIQWTQDNIAGWGSLSSDAGLIGYTPAGVGAVDTTVQTKLRESVSVLDFGAIADDATDNTVGFATAIAAVPVGGMLFFPAGYYRGSLIVWRSDITIMGAGSASTRIKLPNNAAAITVPWESGGTITGLPNVIEISDCAMGNSATARQNVSVIGLTVDGNYANNTEPVTDLFGHGIIATKTSNLVVDDVVAQNCYLTGIDVVINSNYAKVNARVANCGAAALAYPNFDINSSKYGIFNIISSGGVYGGRMLDNCWGNQLNISVYNPSGTGLVYNNQTANSSYSNIINVNVVDGCTTGQGVAVGSNCYNSIINATVRNVTGIGFYVVGSSATYAPRGNQFNINTYYCGSGAVYDLNGLHNSYEITSRHDGKTGAAGSHFAVDVGGKYNKFSVNVEDTSTPQVRGIAVRAGAEYNTFTDFTHNTLVQTFLLSDTSNTTNYPTRYATGASNVQTTLTLEAGWSADYGVNPSYSKDSNGYVSVSGSVSGGAGTLAVLPAGYRPLAALRIPTLSAELPAIVTVSTAGEIAVSIGSVIRVNLPPIRFFAG